MRQHLPDTGLKVEDVFVGKGLAAIFIGDKSQVLDITERELRGEALDDTVQFSLTVGAINYNHRLDPKDAVCTTNGEMYALAGKPLSANAAGFAAESIYVPRIPIDATEADAMMQLVTVFVDATDPKAAIDPESPIRTYAGYTEEELSGGKPSVRVR